MGTRARRELLLDVGAGIGRAGTPVASVAPTAAEEVVGPVLSVELVVVTPAKHEVAPGSRDPFRAAAAQNAAPPPPAQIPYCKGLVVAASRSSNSPSN